MGFGDIHPQNLVERMFICIVLIVTPLGYSIIFGNVALEIQEYNKVCRATCSGLAGKPPCCVV